MIKNKHFWQKISLIIILGGFLFKITESQIQAQARIPLTVIPARQEITVDPGEKTGFIVKFINSGETPVSGYLKTADFIVKDKEGSPVLIEDPSQILPQFSAASWVTLPYNRLTIAAKEKVTINAQMQVPSDAHPGGRYLAVYFETIPPLNAPVGTEKKELAIASRIVSLVYIRVSGPIQEEARLVQFTAPKIAEYGPVKIVSEIINLGSYHIRPKGQIVITNMFGKKEEEVNLKEENIFPQVSRVFENEVGKKWMFGKYKAELTAVYGEGGQALRGTLFFWVIPWKIILAVVLAVLIVIFVLVSIYKRSRQRQKELEKKVAELEKKLNQPPKSAIN